MFKRKRWEYLCGKGIRLVVIIVGWCELYVISKSVLCLIFKDMCWIVSCSRCSLVVKCSL